MITSTGPRAIGLGEVLWDLLPSGPQLGGAPANFAAHAHALGAHGQLISRVGRDELGDEIRRRHAAIGFDGSLLQTDATAPTGTVAVTLSATGQPTFEIVPDVAWDRLEVTPEALAAVQAADVVCFGTLAQRHPTARTALRTLVAAARPGALRLLDLNLRAPHGDLDTVRWSLGAATVLKLNHEELALLAPPLELAGDEHECVDQLGRRHGFAAVALTRGARGSLLWTPRATDSHAGIPVAVRDTVGSGDAFTAAFALGLLAGWPLAEINRQANAVAAFVCTQPGATPPLPPELCALFRPASSVTPGSSAPP